MSSFRSSHFSHTKSPKSHYSKQSSVDEQVTHPANALQTSSNVVDGLRDEIRSVKFQILTEQNIQHQAVMTYLQKVHADITSLRKEMREAAKTLHHDSDDVENQPAGELPKVEKIGNPQDFIDMETRFMSTAKEDIALKKNMVSTHSLKLPCAMNNFFSSRFSCWPSLRISSCSPASTTRRVHW